MANSLLECTSLAPSHQAACVSIKFSPNNDLFASVSADKTVLLFDARRRQYRVSVSLFTISSLEVL